MKKSLKQFLITILSSAVIFTACSCGTSIAKAQIINDNCAYVYDEQGNKTSKVLCKGMDGFLHEQRN